MAAQSGVNMQMLDACLADENVTKIIFNEKAQGKAAGVNSTPTYFINGKMIVGPKPLIKELGQHFGTKDTQ